MNVNGQVLGYIHDGYTISAYISALPRLYPELRFSYRPVLSQNRAVIFRQIASIDDPRKEESIAAQAIKAQMIDWDLNSDCLFQHAVTDRMLSVCLQVLQVRLL